MGLVSPYFLHTPSTSFIIAGMAKVGCQPVPQMTAAMMPLSGYLHRMVRAMKEPMEWPKRI